MSDRALRATFVYPYSFHYRAPFHEHVRAKLSDCGIDYSVSYCEPFGENAKKLDTAEIEWGSKVRLSRIPRTKLLLQHSFQDIGDSDLLIVQQENSLLFNYILQLLPASRRPKVAFFGHGRNFQSRNPGGLSERWKRFWSTRCDWWFAYTEESKRHVASLGFPSERITVFNNAVDISAWRQQLERVTPDRLTERRRELGLKGGNVGVFVGGLYADKRLDFLIDAAVRIRAEIPDFELVIVGGGPAEAELQRLAAPHPWVRLTGPRFGADKAELMSLGKLFLMPGLVGLAILDAGAAGLPMVTTDFPYHSPEIAYLEDGVTGLMVKDWRNEKAYADAVVELLQSNERRDAMAEAAREAAAGYTIEAMAERFAEGVKACCAPGRARPLDAQGMDRDG